MRNFVGNGEKPIFSTRRLEAKEFLTREDIQHHIDQDKRISSYSVVKKYDWI
jgi:hypothetical protein